MNGERFLEAINRLPFQESIEALRSFARSSKTDTHEQALLQMLIVLNLNAQTQMPGVSVSKTHEISETTTTQLTESIVQSFYHSVLPRCSFFQKLAVQLRYPRFLAAYLTWVYGQYRQVRVETLLRYVNRARIDAVEQIEHIPRLLNDTEEELTTKHKSSITDERILYSCFLVAHERWMHRFYTKNLWIGLMWLSLASVTVVSIMVSTKGSPFQFFEAIFGWFEFFREYFR